MTQKKKEPPGSGKVGPHDLRSTDLSGRQADAVKPHSERAGEKRGKAPRRSQDVSGEVAGALKDQVGKSG